VSKIWSIFDPFPRPPRDFALDYPKGAQTDSAGNLTRTMDDDEIRARYLVGRRVEGGADEALSPKEFDALATATTGRPAEIVASSAIKGDAGRLTTSGYRNPTGIALNRDLPEKKVPRVYAHELGHTVDELAGQIDVKGLDTELRFVYNAGVTGQERTTRQTLPQHVGYKDEDVPREYMAEAIRAYMTDPNWLKSVAPKTAKRIRERVNRDDKLGKIIQFNTLAPAVLGTGAAAALFVPGDANAMDPILEHHYRTLAEGKGVRNEDGTVSTVYTMQVDIDGKPTLIPGLWNGEIVDEETAKKNAVNSGIQWPTAETHEKLREYDIKLHEGMREMTPEEAQQFLEVVKSGKRRVPDETVQQGTPGGGRGTSAAAALFAPGDANAMDPEIIQGGLMEKLGMDEGTAYRYAAEISASPELYDDVLAKIGLSDGFQARFRAANPRPAPYDPEAERTSRQRELDAYQDPIRKWAVETLTGFGVPAFTQYNLLGAAEMAPGLGDVIDVQDAALAAGRAYDNPTWGNLGAAGLSGAAAALGIIPGAGDAASKALKRLAGDAGEAAAKR